MFLWPALFALAAHAAKPPRPELPPLQLEAAPIEAIDVTLPSGLRLIVHRAEGPAIVGVSSVWDAGARYDEQPGTARVTAQVMGRRLVDGLAIEEQLERLGCQVHTATDEDFAQFSQVCPTAAVDLALEAELGRFTRALDGITADELAVEGRSTLLGERFARDDGWWEHRAVLAEALLGSEHPYAPVATEASLSEVTLADVASFTAARYVPEAATLVVVGDIDESDVLRRLFEGLPPSAIHPRMKELELEELVLEGMDSSLPWPLNAKGEALSVRKPRGRNAEAGVGAVEPSTTEPILVKGAVDRPHAIVAWTLPGGWRMNDLAMERAAAQLQAWTQNEIERGVYRVDCDVHRGLETSLLVCDISGHVGKRPERLSAGLFRALTREWVDNVATYVMNGTRVNNLAALLEFHDTRADWSSPTTGRAAVMARSAHITGSFDGWTRARDEQYGFDGGQVRDLYRAYLKKKRAVVLYLEPMSDEELLASRPAIAAAKRERPARPAMASEAIAAAFEPSWLEEVLASELDNGMQLIAARSPSPFMDGRIQFRLGDDPGDRRRLRAYLQLPSEAYGGEWSGYRRMRQRSSLLTWDLSGPGVYLENNLWVLRDGLERVQSQGGLEGDGYVWGRFAATAHLGPWLTRRLSPGDPMEDAFTPLELDELGRVTAVDMRPYAKTYIHPQEATLIAMRDLEPRLTLSYMEAHFEGWEGSVRDGPPREPAAAPAPHPVQALGLLDDRRRATALVRVACDAQAAGDRYWERGVVRELVYDRLRMALEDSGAGGSVRVWAEEELNGRPRIEVEARLDPGRVEDGIRTLWAALDGLEDGGYTEAELSAAAYEVSAELALLQQTPGERIEVLSAAAARSDDPLAWIAAGPERLAAVERADLSVLAAGCKTSRVTAVLGPASLLEPQLAGLGLEVEHVPWLDTAFAEAKRLNRTAYGQRKRQFAYKPPRSAASE